LWSKLEAYIFTQPHLFQLAYNPNHCYQVIFQHATVLGKRHREQFVCCMSAEPETKVNETGDTSDDIEVCLKDVLEQSTAWHIQHSLN